MHIKNIKDTEGPHKEEIECALNIILGLYISSSGFFPTYGNVLRNFNLELQKEARESSYVFMGIIEEMERLNIISQIEGKVSEKNCGIVIKIRFKPLSRYLEFSAEEKEEINRVRKERGQKPVFSEKYFMAEYAATGDSAS